MDTTTETTVNKSALRRRLRDMRRHCEGLRTHLGDLTENLDEAGQATTVFDIEEHLQALADNAQCLERYARARLAKANALRDDMGDLALEIELQP